MLQIIIGHVESLAEYGDGYKIGFEDGTETTKMASNSVALEGLPKQFISSMKTLFEIMDDKKTGFVKLSGASFFH